MTTKHHTPIAYNANLTNTIINAVWADLDQQITDIEDGTHNLTTPDINGGSIDGAIIGGATPAAAAFSPLNASGNLAFGDVWLAHRNSSSQSINSGSFTTIEFTNTDLDVNSGFDTVTNYEITPSVAGWYLMYAQVQFAEVLTVSKQMILGIGSIGNVDIVSTSRVTGGTFTESVWCWALAEANGSTDSFYVQIYHDHGAARNISGAKQRTFFAGRRVF